MQPHRRGSYDLTATQFDELPEYRDRPSSREEAFADTNPTQYAALSERLSDPFDDG